MNINWSEFAKLKNVFLRVAVLNCEGEEQKRLEKGLPALFTNRRQPVPLSVILWLLDVREDDNIPLFDGDECFWDDVLACAKIPLLRLEEGGETIQPNEKEWERLLHYEAATLWDKRIVSICTFRGKAHIVLYVSGDSPHGATLIPLDAVDLNA